nr:RNA-directed DNA polymerase, eukaryota [Tanacetum cinerariifolium]
MLFDFATSSARGRSGGILCVWDKTLFHKKRTYFAEHCLCVEGTWLANNLNLLFISVYSPQELSLKRALWTYMTEIINRWHGEVIVMGDFNEVRYASERSYSFTRSDKHASKMSKLDRLILLKESHADYDPTSFRLFHSWFLEEDLYSVIEDSWNNGYFPRRLDYGQSCDLECEVTNEEIKRAVWDCGSDKSPDPDGFTFEFFKKFWSIVGGDVINAVKDLFSSSSFPKGCNSSFIALIPKKAFDSVRWDHLDDILGLRQADPLSLFLFILVMKSLHVSFQWLIDRGMFDPIFVGKDNVVPISHLFYTDDVMFIVPEGILSHLEGLRNKFFLGANMDNRKITGIGILKAINKLKSKGVDLMDFCKLVIGNGNITRFWHDKWYRDVCFKEKFYRLFNLELEKDASVALKLLNPNVTLSFRIPPRLGIEESQLIELLHMLSLVVLSRREKRLPTRINLSNSVLDIPCVLCPNCEADVETAIIFSSVVRCPWIWFGCLVVGGTSESLALLILLPGRRGSTV